MSVHAFVDESKRHGLLLAVALVTPRDLAPIRSTMRHLCLPRQTRVHFKEESNRRRQAIIDAICATRVTVDLYDGTAVRSEKEARAACLHQIVVDLAKVGGRRLVIEQEDSMLRADTHVLFNSRRQAGVEDVLTYDHLRPQAEPLLWIADAAAWCWTQGPGWRRRIAPIVRNEWMA
jgi:hypothetical protein